jgi:hypothetical protein
MHKTHLLFVAFLHSIGDFLGILENNKTIFF